MVSMASVSMTSMASMVSVSMSSVAVPVVMAMIIPGIVGNMITSSSVTTKPVMSVIAMVEPAKVAKK